MFLDSSAHNCSCSCLCRDYLQEATTSLENMDAQLVHLAGAVNVVAQQLEEMPVVRRRVFMRAGRQAPGTPDFALQQVPTHGG